ncbi:hypothetical protein D3C80_1651920 [compost metagenome]
MGSLASNPAFRELHSSFFSHLFIEGHINAWYAVRFSHQGERGSFGATCTGFQFYNTIFFKELNRVDLLPCWLETQLLSSLYLVVCLSFQPCVVRQPHGLCQCLDCNNAVYETFVSLVKTHQKVFNRQVELPLIFG